MEKKNRNGVKVPGSDQRCGFLGPSGSGSVSQSYGSGSFYHQAKKVRKSLTTTAFDFFVTFIVEQ